jgi:hypothetical protein
MDEEMRNAITGHQGNASVGREYGAWFGLKTLVEAIGRIKHAAAVAGLTQADAARVIHRPPSPKRRV